MPPEIRRPWHHAIADLWVADPTLTQREIAKMLNRTETWVSIVVNCDAFKAYLKARQEEFIDPVLTASVEERLKAVANKASEELLRRLEVAPGAIATRDVIGMVNTATKGLGMGQATQPTMQQNLYVLPSPGPRQTAEEWSARARGEVIDVQARQA